MKKTFLQTNLTWIILGVMSVVGTIGGVLMFVYSEKGSVKEVQTWDRGTYPLICPSIPVACGKNLDRDSPSWKKLKLPPQCDQVQKAVTHNNNELSLSEIFKYVPKEKQNGFVYKAPFIYAGVDKVNVHSDSSTIPYIIVVEPPTEEMMKKNGMCDVRNSFFGPRGAAFMKKTTRGAIYTVRVCPNKIQAAIRYVGSGDGSRDFYSRQKDIKTVGYMGVYAHEMNHPYMGGVVQSKPFSLGVNPWIYAHPTHYVGLMAEEPGTLSINRTTKRIFANIYLQCQKELRFKLQAR